VDATTPVIGNITSIRRALLAWHARNGLRAPWRESGDPYQALVAAVMAQQTQMSRVMPSYARFIAAYPTLESLAAASVGDVIRTWGGMGYNQRAVRLHRAARTIAADGWPRDAAALARIDGIGPFTAAIVASFAFGVAAACVDTNVRRVLGRLAGDASLDGTRLQRLADAALPARQPARWNQALMDYGARICTPRPRCDECVVARWCPSREVAAPMVADRRARYDAPARTRARSEPAWRGSARYYRGRIVDALRNVPPGEAIALGRLPGLIGDQHDAPSPADTLEMVRALERAGLLVLREGAVALPP